MRTWILQRIKVDRFEIRRCIHYRLLNLNDVERFNFGMRQHRHRAHSASVSDERGTLRTLGKHHRQVTYEKLGIEIHRQRAGVRLTGNTERAGTSSIEYRYRRIDA